MKNDSQKNAVRVNYHFVSHRVSEIHAEQNGNLERHEVSQIEDRVQCQTYF